MYVSDNGYWKCCLFVAFHQRDVNVNEVFFWNYAQKLLEQIKSGMILAFERFSECVGRMWLCTAWIWMCIVHCAPTIEGNYWLWNGTNLFLCENENCCSTGEEWKKKLKTIYMFNILSPTERWVTVAVVHVTLPKQSLMASGIQCAFFFLSRNS